MKRKTFYKMIPIILGCVMLAACGGSREAANSGSAMAPELVPEAVPAKVTAIDNGDNAERVKPRVCITNDGEIDDKNSYIHLLYYADEMDLVGLVQTSSFVHWQGDASAPKNLSGLAGSFTEEAAWPGTDWQKEFIDEYAKIYDNLVVHNPEYPTPDYLKSIVKIGNIAYAGEMESPSEGSEWIKELILDEIENQEEPLYLTAWGGMNTIGKALMDLHAEYSQSDNWDEMIQKIYDKVLIYAWYGSDGSDPAVTASQDLQFDSEDPTVYCPVLQKVIAPYYPEITIVDIYAADALGWGSDAAVTIGSDAKGEPVVNDLAEVLSGAWMKENLDQGHGPLLDTYYVTCGDGTHVAGESPMMQYGENLQDGKEQYQFCGEGDTPTFLPFFDFGLNSLADHCMTGSLSGRYIKTGRIVKDAFMEDGSRKEVELPNYYVCTDDAYVMSDWNNVGAETKEAVYDSSARWVSVVMNDFAAKADWGMTSEYSSTNHRPSLSIAEGNTLEVSEGNCFTLSAETADPDGDSVSVSWYPYMEAGSYSGNGTVICNVDDNKAEIILPADAASGDEFIILVKAQDDGTHNLSYFNKVKVIVK